jgi:Zn-dependent protease
MGWEDRPYYRDRGGSGSLSNPLMWIVTGSVPLFTAFGIRVRAHAWLVIYVASVLLFGFGAGGYTLQDRVAYVAILFGIVLLHEFGHCFTARAVGGHAEDILMHPLGGLAFAQPPHRPLPTFLTVAGGPAVNVVICILCGIAIWAATGHIPWNPFHPSAPRDYRISPTALNVFWYAFWIFQVSWQLFVFNLLPIYPLDGGQMLQAAMWPKLGYYKSMIVSLTVGMVGAVLGAMWALAFGNISLGLLAVLGFVNCLNRRRELLAAGPEMVEDQIDYSAAYENPTRRRTKGPSRWAARRAVKERDRDRAEQADIDAILAKVSAKGMQSLNWREKRTLKKATERQRQRDLELARNRSR